MSTMPRVCVIGAGPSGIAAAKNCIAAGLDTVVYERGEKVGGNWVATRITACLSQPHYPFTSGVRHAAEVNYQRFRRELLAELRKARKARSLARAGHVQPIS